jgi:hypothetical protein
LNKKNVPEKWDSILIKGVNPLPEMILSLDQDHREHPERYSPNTH